VISGNNGEIGREQIKKAIWEKTKEMLKDEAKQSGIRLTRFNGREGIVHCYHLYKDETIKILNSINRIDGRAISIKTVGTSGTIKALNRKFFQGRLKKSDDPDFLKWLSKRR